MTLLEGRGIGRLFGQGELAVRALEPCDVAFYAGEVTVIVGPSGSGKSTLLSILGLVLTPTEGEVWLAGNPVPRRSADELAALRREHVSFVFQQFNLLAGLSALENVEVPLMLGGRQQTDRRAVALHALEVVGLRDRAHHRPRALSGGQQQRVAIARALASKAKVLLCDEPTASLDHQTGTAILQVLRRLASETQRAVVIVTHDPRVIQIADRCIDVCDGRASERPHSLALEVS